MALTAGTNVVRRGRSPAGEFGYPVAPGERVFRNGLVGINASGQMQRIQTAGCVAFLGVADRDLDNTASSAASGTSVIAQRGIFGLVVPSAAPANINAAVYASDDNTLTLTQNGAAPYLLQAGHLSGIEGGLTYIKTFEG
jgi:hypothetical protein